MSNLLTASSGPHFQGRCFCQDRDLAWSRGNVAAGLQLGVPGITVNHHPLKIKINGDTVIQAFANHSLSLNVNVLPVFNGQHLHQLAVYVQRDSLGLDAEGDFVPVAVKQVTDPCVSEDHPDSVLGESNGVVLHSFVLSIQPDRDLGYAILVYNLPDIPVFFPGSLPEFESSYKGIFIRQALWKYILSFLNNRKASKAYISTLNPIFWACYFLVVYKEK